MAADGGVLRDEEPRSWAAQKNPSDTEADELMREARRAVIARSAHSAAYDAPAAKMQYALRRDRRKVAIQLYHEITCRLTEQVRQLEELHGAALGELVRRTQDPEAVKAMPIDEVMGLVRLTAAALAPYVKRLALPPEKPEVDSKTAAAAGVAELFGQIIHARRAAAAVEVSSEPVHE